MNPENSPPNQAPARPILELNRAGSPKLTLDRLWRITRKELRETLRDRRTIITLLLMPLLVYPLLSLVFYQFLMTSQVQPTETTWSIGVLRDDDYAYIKPLLEAGDALVGETIPPAEASEKAVASPLTFPVPGQGRWQITLGRLNWFVTRDSNLEQLMQNGEIDLGLRIIRTPAPDDKLADAPFGGPVERCEILCLPNSATSMEAARFLERRLRAVNQQTLIERLEKAGQSTAPAINFTISEAPRDKPYVVPMATLIPLILILMTITGAVYPAIDLTAGERERGTLESLIASPMSRFTLLIGKYIAVLTVAVLTALMNITAMTITVQCTDLNSIVFGASGFSAWAILAVFGLMVLFAAFYSALLLTLTSFARSFKEAQAYLIPLMLISMTPGFLSAMPGVKLEGWWAVAPLANIVLLARDVLEQGADPSWAIVALASTFIYGFSALVIAAQIFGNDAILYGSQESWDEWLYRPKKLLPAPTAELIFLTLVIIFPLFIWLSGTVALWGQLTLQQRLIGNSLITAFLFVCIPVAMGWWRRVSFQQAFQIRPFKILTLLGAIILGCSMLPIAFELVLLSKWMGLAPNFEAQKEFVAAMVKEFDQLPLPFILFCLAVMPAICEELFFRGFLFTALSRLTSGVTVILLSGVLFGLFHVFNGRGMQVERLFSTLVIGLVLGWIAYRSRSIFPGMIAHMVHNTLPFILAIFMPWMNWGGLDVGSEDRHLPLSWHLAAGLGLALGFWLVWWSTTEEAGKITKSD